MLLTTLEANFLYLESTREPMNVGCIFLVEKTKHTPSRLLGHLRDEARQKLSREPFFYRVADPLSVELGSPVWKTAEDVDMRSHIRELGARRRRTFAQLVNEVRDLHGELMDRSKPLWNLILINNVTTDRQDRAGEFFAVYFKAHHACADGMTMIRMLGQLLDAKVNFSASENRPVKARVTSEPISSGGTRAEPASAGLQAVRDVVAAGVKSAPELKAIAGRVATLVQQRESGSAKPRIPNTRFNGNCGQDRAYATQELSLKSIKRIGKSYGATVNDVVLCLCGGALRRYLASHEELPPESLVAHIPVALSDEDGEFKANNLSAVSSALGTDIADPVERLKVVSDLAQQALADHRKTGPLIAPDAQLVGASWLLVKLSKLVNTPALQSRIPLQYNVSVSNVRGPSRHGFLLGGRVSSLFPIATVGGGCCLTMTIIGYGKKLHFGLIACADTVPDADVIADNLRKELNLMLRKLASD